MLSLPIRFFFIFALSFWPFAGPAQQVSEVLETSLSLPQDTETFRYIRVLLTRKKLQVKIESPDAYQVYDVNGRPLMKGKPIKDLMVQASPTGLLFGNQNFRTPMLRVVSEGKGLKLADRLFRHSFIIWREEDSTVTVINELEIDDYLKGVLPWEANPKWDHEALKAQAVVSRTYALFKSIERQDRRYSVTGDVMSQVYKGRDIEKPETNRAVEETYGQILTYDQNIFPAYFHSTCAGGTTDAKFLWNVRPHPVLKGVKCNFCQASKHYRWRNEISREHIENALKKWRKPAPGIYRVEPVDFDSTGRAKYFDVYYEGGKYRIHSNDFRLWVGPSKLKSTLIQVAEPTATGFSFEGRGWGHGVGLCQYGMKHLGELGYKMRKILDYYFPDASLTQYYA